MEAEALVRDILYGRWRSQILFAGVKLGVLEAATSASQSADQIAKQCNLDEDLGYRLMRALASIGLLVEHDGHSFSLSEAGSLLQSDHSRSMRGLGLLVNGPVHYAVWNHLTAIVQDGKQDGFVREYGRPAFEYAETDADYAASFDAGMSSYSRYHSALVLETLDSREVEELNHICDVGGGQGHLLSQILLRYPHLKGTVLERAGVVANKELLWGEKLGLGDRCRYVAGDMFADVPAADAYFMKMILHDWNDAECVDILSIQFKRAPVGGRVFVVEHVIPGPETSHFSKLFDIHMMVWGTGRERTSEEYAGLLKSAGWQYKQTRFPEGGSIAIVEGVKVL